MMEGPSQNVKDCTIVAYDYLVNKSDKNLVALEKHLHSLSLVSDLEVFELSSSESLELYLCLEKFLTPTEARSMVAGKVLALLTHISESPSIKAALRDDIKIVPVLSSFLVNSKLSKDNLFKTLKLLNAISHRIKVCYLEGWIMELLPFLTDIITEGTPSDESLLLALQTLANLCRCNPPVQEHLSRLPNNKMLLKTLLSMKNATMCIKLLVIEMLFIINPKFSDAVLSSDEMMDMIFLVALEGYEENLVSSLQLAADVFEELSTMPSLEPAFREYKNYGTHLQLLLTRMTAESSDPLNEALIDFLCCLVKFNHQDIRALHEAILSKVTEWLHSLRCGHTAVRVLKELMNTAAANSLTTDTMDVFVATIKKCLTCAEDRDMTMSELQHITVILSLVDHISTSNKAMQLKFAWHFEPSLFSDLLKQALILDSKYKTGGQEHMMAGERSADSSQTSGYESSGGRHGSAPHNESGRAAASGRDNKFRQRENVSKAVIFLLVIIKGLGAVKSEHLAEYRKMMGMPAVMSHLIWGGLSGLTEFVTRAWNIISDGSLSKECLEALVTATEESSKMGGLHDTQRMYSSNNHMATMPANFEEKVDTIIARLGGIGKKKEFRDSALTDVMNMYEYKLTSLAHSEQSLQKALKIADIQNRQTGLLHFQANIQNDHLRNLLTKWESRIQNVQAEKAELQTTLKDIEESSSQFKENFINEKENLERKVKDTKKELVSMKSSLKVSEENNTKLQQQLAAKTKDFQAQIQEEREKGLKLGKHVQKLDEEIRQSARCVENLKKEVANLEDVNLQLKKENSDLEFLVKSKDEALAAKEEELEEANVKLNKMAEIQNMIHDISSRRVMK